MAALSGSPDRGRDASRPMSRVATRAQRPPRTARRLMAVAQHPVIAKGTHASVLPPSWTTLYELTRLPEETLEAKIAEGGIHAGIERKDAEGFLEPHRDEPAVAPILPSDRRETGLWDRLRRAEWWGLIAQQHWLGRGPSTGTLR